MYRISELLEDLGLAYERLSDRAETSVRRFETGNTAGVEDCLVLSAANLRARMQRGEQSTTRAMLIIGDEADGMTKAFEAAGLLNMDVYYLPGEVDASELADRLNQRGEAMARRLEQLVHIEYRALVNLLSRGAGISEIEAAACRLLGNPMIITDESYKVLAYTRDREVQDPVWESITTNAYSTAILVQQTDVNNFWERLERSPLPLFVDDMAFKGLIRRAVAKIRIGSQTKGYIALLEAQRQITRLDLYVLQMVAEVLSVKINETDTVLRATGQLRDELTGDLLTGNIANAQMAENRSRSLGLNFSRWNCVLGIQSRDGAYIGGELDNLRALLRPHCSLCIYTFGGSQGYFILSFQNRDQWRFLTQERLEEILLEQGMLGVLSLPIEGLELLSRCYRQVERIRLLLPRITRPDLALYPCSVFAPLDLVARMKRGEEGILLSGAFLALQASDAQEGTEYVPTLRAFFACNQNVSDTAARLFLHRNTVNYRLGRIRELLEDDFDHPLIRLHLQMSILADDLNRN